MESREKKVINGPKLPFKVMIKRFQPAASTQGHLQEAIVTEPRNPNDVDRIALETRLRNEQTSKALISFRRNLAARVKGIAVHKKQTIRAIQDHQPAPQRTRPCARKIERSLSDEQLHYSKYPASRKFGWYLCAGNYLIYPDEKYQLTDTYFPPNTFHQRIKETPCHQDAEKELRMFYRAGWIDEMQRLKSGKDYQNIRKCHAFKERERARNILRQQSTLKPCIQPRVERYDGALRQQSIFSSEPKIKIFGAIQFETLSTTRRQQQEIDQNSRHL